jgi:hypothetical protein
MKTRIVHLSDLHIGNPTPLNNIAVDKQFSSLAGALQPDPLGILKERLVRLNPKLDFLVVSGDIIHRGDEQPTGPFSPFKIFVEFVSSLVAEQILEKEKVVVVPGNHDVMSGDVSHGHQGARMFFESMDPGYVMPWPRQNSGTQNRKVSLVDYERKIVIYTLNSSQFRRCTTKEGNDIDLSRVDSQELVDMKNFFDELKTEIDEASYCDWLSICVFHDPLMPIAHFEDIQRFGYLSNAAQIRRSISECGIHLVLHGHRHEPAVYFGAGLQDENGFIGVSGGALYEKTMNGKSQGFHILDFDSENPHEVSISYIDLSTGNECERSRALLHSAYSCFFNEQYQMSKIVKDIGKKLSGTIISAVSDDNIECHGWDKQINNSTTVGIIATAIGLCVMETSQVRNAEYQAVRDKIIQSLWEQRDKASGLFGSHSIRTPNIPASCWVAKAMIATREYRRCASLMKSLLSCSRDPGFLEASGAFETAFLLTSLLDWRSLYNLKECDMSILRALKDRLQKKMIRSNGIAYWHGTSNENAKDKNAKDDLSSCLATTSHAILALLDYEAQVSNEDSGISGFKSEWQAYLQKCKVKERTWETLSIGGRNMWYEHNPRPWLTCALLRLGLPRHHPFLKSQMQKMLFDMQTDWLSAADANIWTAYDFIAAEEIYLHSDIFL